MGLPRLTEEEALQLQPSTRLWRAARARIFVSPLEVVAPQSPACQESMSVQHRRRVSRHAHPLPALVHPGVDKLLATCIRFSIFHAFNFQYTSCDGGIAEHPHTHRFRRHLLLLHVRRVYTSAEFSLLLHTH